LIKKHGGTLVKEMDLKSKNRVRILYIVLTGIFAIFIIRFGYMQFIYQNNIVTFAQMDQNVHELNAPIIEEVKKSFDVKIDDYTEVSTDEIINDGKTDVAALSLLDIVYSSCQKGCIGRPGIYLKDNNGYVFYKNSNGENLLIEIYKENNKWMISNTHKSR
jgi:phage host-nuclease inhibitor protein Gam